MSSFNWMVLMSRLRLLTSRCVAKSASRGLVDDFALDGFAARHHHAQAVAQLHGVGLRLRQRRVNPGLGQVHDGDNRRAHGHHFALPGRPHIHLAAYRRQDLGITFLDPGLVGQRAGICNVGAR